MKNKWIFLIVSAFVFFQSCAPVYIPNNSNVPLFTEKGEVQLAAYQGTNGTNIQAAVSVIDHLAVMGNLGFRVHENKDADKNNKQKFREVGIGFYDTFNEKKGRFEFYGGYGNGTSTAYNFFNNKDNVRVEGKFERWFLQANVGLGNNIVEGALSYRVSYIQFYSVTEFGPVNVLLDPMEEVMMEPAFTFKVGSENIKFVSQFGISFPYDDYAKFDYEPFYISIGIQGKIPAW